MPIDPIFGTAAGVIGNIAGGAIQRGQFKRDRENERKYQSPTEQLKRMREAGLPMAAMGNNVSTGASPMQGGQTDGGARGAGEAIGRHAKTSLEIQQLKLLGGQTRSANAAADLDEAKTQFLLDGKGNDSAGSNLTSILGTEADILKGTEKGLRITQEGQKLGQIGMGYDNLMKKYSQGVQSKFADQEYKKTNQEIANLVEGEKGMKSKRYGQDLSNQIEEVTLEYKPWMTEAQYGLLLKDKGLREAQVDNQKLRNKFEEATFELRASHIDETVWRQQLERLEAEGKFKNARELRQMKSEGRKLFQPDEGNFNILKLSERGAALLYTSLHDFTGGGNSNMGAFSKAADSKILLGIGSR